MSKEMTVIVLGALVAVLPYVGIPGSWRTVLLLVAGLALALIGFLLRGEAIARGGRSSGKSFVESSAPTDTHDAPQGISSLN